MFWFAQTDARRNDGFSRLNRDAGDLKIENADDANLMNSHFAGDLEKLRCLKSLVTKF